MLGKTIEIATAGTRLSVKHQQLVIERPDHEAASVPIEDIGLIILDHAQCSLTQPVLTAILEAGAVIMASDHTHLPLGLILPFNRYHSVAARQIAQAQASQPLKKRLWQQLVKNKISGQARVLDQFHQTDGGLNALVNKVRSGDPDNVEAWAAQKYWPILFGKDFRRDHNAEGINSLLNYGYAVVRATCARYLVASGMNPALGVFHKNRANPFCLADDLVEAFRPLVDWQVMHLLLENQQGNTPETLSLNYRPTRARLLGLLNEVITLGKRNWPISLAIEVAAAALARALSGEGEAILPLPQSLPLSETTHHEAYE